MNQIVRCDWLTERARWSYLARSGFLAWSRKIKDHFWCSLSHIIFPLLTKLVRSKMAGYLPRSFFGTYTKHGPQVHGPPLWTGSMDPFMDPVHGPPLWTTPYFIKLQAENSADEREKRYLHLSGQFKLPEPMTTIYVTAFNICIDYDVYRLPFSQKKKQNKTKQNNKNTRL